MFSRATVPTTTAVWFTETPLEPGQPRQWLTFHLLKNGSVFLHWKKGKSRRIENSIPDTLVWHLSLLLETFDSNIELSFVTRKDHGYLFWLSGWSCSLASQTDHTQADSSKSREPWAWSSLGLAGRWLASTKDWANSAAVRYKRPWTFSELWLEQFWTCPEYFFVCGRGSTSVS